jgi:hypothetical protein
VSIGALLIAVRARESDAFSSPCDPVERASVARRDEVGIFSVAFSAAGAEHVEGRDDASSNAILLGQSTLVRAWPPSRSADAIQLHSDRLDSTTTAGSRPLQASVTPTRKITGLKEQNAASRHVAIGVRLDSSEGGKRMLRSLGLSRRTCAPGTGVSATHRSRSNINLSPSVRPR